MENLLFVEGEHCSFGTAEVNISVKQTTSISPHHDTTVLSIINSLFDYYHSIVNNYKYSFKFLESPLFVALFVYLILLFIDPLLKALTTVVFVLHKIAGDHSPAFQSVSVDVGIRAKQVQCYFISRFLAAGCAASLNIQSCSLVYIHTYNIYA